MTTRPAELAQRLWVSTIVFGLLAAISERRDSGVARTYAHCGCRVVRCLPGGVRCSAGLAGVCPAGRRRRSPNSLSFVSGAASIILGVLAFRHFDEGYAFLLLAIWIAIGLHLPRRSRRRRGARRTWHSGPGVGHLLQSRQHHRRRCGARLPIPLHPHADLRGRAFGWLSLESRKSYSGWASAAMPRSWRK